MGRGARDWLAAPQSLRTRFALIARPSRTLDDRTQPMSAIAVPNASLQGAMPVGLVLLERRSRRVLFHTLLRHSTLPSTAKSSYRPYTLSPSFSPARHFLRLHPSASALSPQPSRSLNRRLTRPDLTCYHRAGTLVSMPATWYPAHPYHACQTE